MGEGKLTKAQRRVMEYLRDKGSVRLWPMEVLPRGSVRRDLHRAGLIESIRPEGDVWRSWRITEAGRSALSEGEKS